jgi:hypothetical protein
VGPGGAVDYHRWAGLEGGGGRHVDDSAAAAPNHSRDEEPGELGECDHVHLEYSVECRESANHS